MPDRSYPALTAAVTIARRAFPASVRARLRQWMFEWLDLAWETPTGIRLRVEQYVEWIVYNEIFVNGDYDQAIALALNNARSHSPATYPGTLHIVDLGANVGYFTLRAFDRLLDAGLARESISVIAVEANETHVQTCASRLFNDNRLALHVRLVNGLVGKRDGRAVFDGDQVQDAEGTAADVPYLDLAETLSGLERIDLLKCDIEGSEQALIESYPDVLAKTGVAVFELHSDRCDTSRCRALLREYGFTHSVTRREGSVYSLHTVWR